MESPFNDIREDLDEMKSKMPSDSNSMCKKKYRSYNVEILTILSNIEKLIKTATPDPEIIEYNEVIPPIIKNVRSSLTKTTEGKRNEELLTNIIRLYEALLTRDIKRSNIHIRRNILFIGLELVDSRGLPKFYFNEKIYNDLYDYFCQMIEIRRIEMEESEKMRTLIRTGGMGKMANKR